MTWTRLIRFVAQEDGKVYYGDAVEPGDIGLLYNQGRPLTARVIDVDTDDLNASPLGGSVGLTGTTLTVRKLLPPLAPSSVTTIRGLGLQYAPPGVSTSEAKPPSIPCLFIKPSSSIAGPQDEIVLPQSSLDEKPDYECELCVVIGPHDVPPNTSEADAMQYVAGYCVVNDVTSRGLCGKGGAGQWGMGKNYDSWCPIGPCIVRPSVLVDPEAQDFKTHLNGRLVQKGNTRDLLVHVPKLISLLSSGSTLSRSSLILTGSPVALGRKAPTDVSDESPFLHDGDEVRCWVEGIGTLVNTARAETRDHTMVKPYKAKL